MLVPQPLAVCGAALLATATGGVWCRTVRYSHWRCVVPRYSLQGGRVGVGGARCLGGGERTWL